MLNPTCGLLARAALGIAAVCMPAGAQQPTQFQQLGKAVASRLQPIPEDQKLVDCSHADVATLENGLGSGMSQWIFNGAYAWRHVEIDGGICVFLVQPEHRGLTREEAWTLLSASKLQFPNDPETDANLRAQTAKEKAYGEWATNLASFGGTATEEQGSINGLGYRIRYLGIDASLAPLDRAQHHFAELEKHALSRVRSRNASANTTESAFALDLEFRSGGRTKELAVLVAEGHRAGADESADRIGADWMLHIPSGRLLTFDDLFADPSAARVHFSEVYRSSLESRRSFYAVLGDGQHAREFAAAYKAADLQASSPTQEHFRHLKIGTVDPSRPTLIIEFTMTPLLPNIGECPHLESSAEYFRELLRPEYRTAFNGTSYPE